uniref:GIY-YIG endonuclease n=1 Tax=Ophiocordyceps sinensis TaxID=72228 RepID=A0A1W5T0V9_9HYPO|nr:GIY-YIG endonuclease [Ophiocordyceps sinensis]ARF03382.1 GIY-YIG endonuclease [Ophiocordyceps sinensis]QDH07237.1 GIY-YIG endonuclease [Ophiocordyceps sinensis]
MSLSKLKRNHSCTNQVALRGLYNNSLYSKLRRKNLSMQFVRFYCTDTSLIKELYKDRLAPVKPFTDKIILSVSNILNLAQRAEFFNQASQKNKGKGGIYLIQYKYEPLVYYIGRTNNFERRLSDKFHVFANIVGWDNFTISIVEFSEIEYLGIRENYYPLRTKIFTFIKFYL